MFLVEYEINFSFMENNMDEKNLIKAYCGYVNDENKLLSSASGGFASQMAALFIERGGIVFGVRYTDDFYSAEYCVVDKIEDLKLLAGSKYIIPKKVIDNNSVKKSVYAWAGDALLENKKVLFIGLGCDIGALHGYLKKNEISTEQLFTIDLICHGPTIPEVQESCVHELEKKYNSKVVEFSVRYKKDGWVPPYLHAVFENGSEYNKPFYDSDYGYAFENYIRKSCYNCRFKGRQHIADLTIGDYWGISKEMQEYNKNGVSIIFSRTSKGDFLIDHIKDSCTFTIYNADMKMALDNNPMYGNSRKINQNFDVNKFSKDLKEKGLHYATLQQRGLIKTILIPLKRTISNRMSIDMKKKIKKLLCLE